jgi:glc operon protein GlcG
MCTMRKIMLTSLAICAVIVFAANARAQGGPPPYGETINIAMAKKAAAAAVAEAAKNKWQLCVSVVAPSGDLIYFERMDTCQFASITISQQKARSAAIYRRATKSFGERLAKGGGGLAILTLDRAIASEGGVPLVVGGKIIGAIGCSGAASSQDGQSCEAGAAALK